MHRNGAVKKEIVMAINTVLHIYTKDAQGLNGYAERVTVGVTQASFGSTTLPTKAQIEAFINALFGTTLVPSSSIVHAYSIEVKEDNPVDASGGLGGAATAIALKTRNDVSGAQDVDGWELRIPGLDKARVLFDPANSNAAIMASTQWTNARTAAVAIGFRNPEFDDSTALTALQIFQSGIAFNGKRAPKRPR
jgi:hypothetical protein